MLFRLVFFLAIILLAYYVYYLFKRDSFQNDYAELQTNPRKLNQNRGKILTPNRSDDVFTFVYNDYYEEDTDLPYLSGLGYEGGPASWQGIVKGILSLKAPSILKRIKFEESDRDLVITSFDEASLETISLLIGTAKSDEKLLRKAIHEAEKKGEMM